MQTEEIANFVIKAIDGTVVEIRERLLEIRRRHAVEQPARLRLQSHDRRRFQRLQKAAGKTNCDAILYPASPVSAHSHLDGGLGLEARSSLPEELSELGKGIIVALELTAE